MDASLVEELIAKNKPFKIETASGRVFEVPHRDLIRKGFRNCLKIPTWSQGVFVFVLNDESIPMLLR